MCVCVRVCVSVCVCVRVCVLHVWFASIVINVTVNVRDWRYTWLTLRFAHMSMYRYYISNLNNLENNFILWVKLDLEMF